MRIDVLSVADCPNSAVALERVRQALGATGKDDVEVVSTEVADANEAASLGLRGSPTILIDGVDLFAPPDEPTSLACRLYRNGDAVAGAPSTERLIEALRR